MAELQRGLQRHKTTHQERGEPCTLRALIHGATNDVNPGLQAVDKAIRNGMTVDPSCVGLLGEIPGYT